MNIFEEKMVKILYNKIKQSGFSFLKFSGVKMKPCLNNFQNISFI